MTDTRRLTEAFDHCRRARETIERTYRVNAATIRRTLALAPQNAVCLEDLRKWKAEALQEVEARERELRKEADGATEWHN